MNQKIKTAGLVLALLLACTTVYAKGSQDTDNTVNNTEIQEVSKQLTGIDAVAAELGVKTETLEGALGDPSQGAPDFDDAAEKLGVDAEELENMMKEIMGNENSVKVDPYTITVNGVDFEIIYEVFTWDELPSDVVIERQEIETFTNSKGDTHYYELIYVVKGNLNWYQAAYLAYDAGAYMACPESEEENAFVFSLVDDKKYFWSFPEEGDHYGISIGPFLGGYQPVGSVEPAGGWSWLSGEAWDYTNWARNLDDGIIDLDPRDNTQPNNSGASQPIMGFGEMNLPVPTWGDYMEAVGTYGENRLPGRSYAFIIEYESDPK